MLHHENFFCNSEKLSLSRKTSLRSTTHISLRSHDILQWNCIERHANVLVGWVTDPSKLFNKSLSYSFNNSLLVIIIMTNKLLPVAISTGHHTPTCISYPYGIKSHLFEISCLIFEANLINSLQFSKLQIFTFQSPKIFGFKTA